MGPNNLLRSTKLGAVTLALLSPLLFAACTEVPVEPSAGNSETPMPQERSEEQAEMQEAKSVYEAFNPARLTKLTEKRIAESSDSKLIFVAEGLIKPNSELSIPKITTENEKSLLVSYMCRSSADEGAPWRVDFRADSEPLNTGVESGSCTTDSVEMFITRELSPAELPEALEATGKVELAVSIFEIEESH